MANIPDTEIDRVKRSSDLLALARSRGLELKKHGSKDFIGKCPFHADGENPNFIVSPHKGLYHCLSCGAAGNAIQFVQKFDGVSFRHAFELLSNGAALDNPPQRVGKERRSRTLECPLDAASSDAELMQQIIEYYHSRLLVPENQKARDMLTERGLWDEEAIKHFKIGYADRSLGLRLPNKQSKDGGELRVRLIKLGLYRDSGHEHFNGSVVVPITNEAGEIKEIYGRKVTKALRKGTPNHLYLAGKHAGVWNHAALKETELILCEAPLDALTLYVNGVKNVSFIFGTQGFTDELMESLVASPVQQVTLAYDSDKAGDRASIRDSANLKERGLSVSRIKLPMGEDINSFCLSHGAEALKNEIAKAENMDSRASQDTSSLLAAKLAAEGGNATESSEDAFAANEKKLEISVPPLAQLVTVGEHHELDLGGRRYRVGSLFKNGGLDSLKITLRLWASNEDVELVLFHVDQIDLCRDVDRRRFCERAAHECRLEKDLIKRDLGKLLLACEQTQDARFLSEIESSETPEVELTPEEREAAMELLKSPDLMEKLDQSFDEAGIVGESSNRLAAYLTATSRLLSKPLAIIIQSTSAAGKTTLMEAVLAFFPAESQVKYSAMTGQSLYYLGEKNLKHKILAIVEEEGAEKASYALKLLQSEGELTIASTGKDSTTGRMKTEEYHVEGPVSIVLTTTSIDIDEELMNRCLILTVDESREQTERIHALQRTARTLEGLRLKKKRKRVLTLLQNAQRLLTPIEIVNPHANRLTFTADRTRTRRDHEKYLTLIESVTLLHQHQRPLEEDPVAGVHIKTTLEDIATANRLAPELLGRSLDELAPQTRRLLEDIKALVRELCENEKLDQDRARFKRRDVRARTGWSEFQVRTHMQKLEDLEFLARRHGKQGSGCIYELLIDRNEPEGVAHVGLIDLKEIPTQRCV